MVTQGGLGYFVGAMVLATRALVQQHAGQLEGAERSSRAAIGRAQASGSRVWEILATLVWLRLPVDASRRAEADAALARVATLLDFTGAEGFRPLLYLARAHGSDSAAAPARDGALARVECAALCAFAHTPQVAATYRSAPPPPRSSVD